MKFTIYQESRQGQRKNNEDRIAYCYSRDALLMVVADGMGGHYYGEIASQIAAQALADAFNREARPALEDPFSFLQRGMTTAHHAILDFAADHALNDSPRTTCVACIVQDNVAYWAHSGDSRLYLMRDGHIVAQTQDHSRVRILFERGILTEAQMLSHPERNKIFSCLGGDRTPEIALSRRTPLMAGDVLLLCTDGFWGPLPSAGMASALHQSNLLQAVPDLMDQAEKLGGAHCDNLSVVAARWEDSYIAGLQDLPSAISTQTMTFDEITTQLDEFGRNPAYKLDLSEDEIEKAIQEIRSTIDKYSTKK